MLFTMLVSLYTSRVILQTLGVDDYGTYQAVGGIVTMLSFVNSALSGGTSRFLTFELGTGDVGKLKRTFSTLLTLHILLAILIIIVAETLGVWFVANKLVIPEGRMEAAMFAYQMTVITSVFTLTQVPYGASIISHEKMGVYAYLSIFETLAKLLIVYLLAISSWDKLKLFALLLCVLQIGTTLYYRFYCIRHFKETRFSPIIDKDITKNVLGYSVWNLVSSISIPLKNQGLIIVLNVFFSPAVVTARAIANQVSMAANQFVQNFRTAVNPQIVKKYASGDRLGSKSLLLNSTKYSYYMMLLLCLPICLFAEPILRLWLGEYPEYTVIFLRLTLVSSLFQVFDTSFYTALYAMGRIKENALISPVIGILIFPIIYLLFKLGYSPVSMAWVLLMFYAFLGLIVKPILLVRFVGYTWKDIWSVFKPCFLVTIIAEPIPLYMTLQCTDPSILYFTSILMVTLMVTTFSIYFGGIDKETRKKILSFIRTKIRR